MDIEEMMVDYIMNKATQEETEDFLIRLEVKNNGKQALCNSSTDL